ncbi:MAG: Gfo/Idh/MocA family oxidoreductase [Candidatus Nitrohelix vancouverensis]|uniref:Gfo/Idh/MocA family oxidoreductase n=1 Tax=Candidatus Nitrohelix vancouverensis TaxID=2705534 RepID=A0A7T0C031_9BACT|nr:MAG: Gfo/Idh/MocA family oxidoreductase [Candidatus Nitrohelix vancouverensis]
MINLGVLGMSPGNGHPYSFSAIINGYNGAAMDAAGWGGIHDYLRRRKSEEFGIEGVRVSHVWTQDYDESARLSRASNVATVCRNLDEMVDAVDGALIARDDYMLHRELAEPFLKRGKFVFVDKPLSLNVDDMIYFSPYLENAQLMSCSGMRFARELDEIRNDWASFGKVKLIRATVLNDWRKYGVHMIDALLGLTSLRPINVSMAPVQGFESRLIQLDNGSIFQVDNLGETCKTFRFDIFGATKNGSFDLHDNFSAFKRLLEGFVQQIRTGTNTVPMQDTNDSMRLLIAGIRAQEEKRTVLLEEIKI